MSIAAGAGQSWWQAMPEPKPQEVTIEVRGSDGELWYAVAGVDLTVEAVEAAMADLTFHIVHTLRD